MFSTRRKSCTACVRRRRRCDLALPKCQLCSRRGVHCKYPWQISVDEPIPNREMVPASRGSVAVDDTFLQIPETVLPAFSASIPGQMSPGMLSEIDSYITSNDLARLSRAVAPLSTVSADQQLLQTHYYLVDIPEGPTYEGAEFQDRTEYTARRLAHQPRVLVDLGQNAFIHHTDVSKSADLQDALAASALYCMRNATNATLIRGEIARRAAQLISSVHAAATSTVSHDIDLLAALQALLIYQCLRLFSDAQDIRLRIQAEQDASLVRILASSLTAEVRPPVGVAEDWLSWVREESLRRTVLMAEIIIGIWDFLTKGFDHAGARVNRLGYTASAALWEARSSTEWEVQWTRGPRYEVKICNWEEDTPALRPEAVEELTVSLYGLKHGLEPLEKWLGGEKAELVRWGLRPDYRH